MYPLLPFILFIILPMGLQSQSFFDLYTIQNIQLDFYQSDWHRQLDSLKRLKSEGRLPASLLVNGEEAFDSVGVRYKGNSSFNSASRNEERKLPINIKLDKYHDNYALKEGFDKIKLSNVFRDPSFMREVLSYEVARRYTPASRANFARVYVGDQYLGLYNSTESVEGEFLEAHFGDDGEGVLFKCDPIWGAEQGRGCKKGEKASLMYLGNNPNCYFPYYEKKSDDGWLELVELTRILTKEPEKIEEALNVDLALWMLAFNVVMVNLDSYSGALCHNYYLYQDTSGRFNPILWDMNMCLGGFRRSGETDRALSDQQLITLNPLVHFDNPKRPLISVLLKNKRYRNLYLAHVRTIVEDYFSSGYLDRKIDTLYQFLKEDIQKDPNRLYPYEAFEQNLDSSTGVESQQIIGLRQLIRGRTAFLENLPFMQKTPPQISPPQAIEEGDQLKISVQVQQAREVWLFFRKEGTYRYQKLTMEATEADRYETRIPLPDGKIQYYLLAENPELSAVYPTNASWFFLEFPADP